MVAFFALLVALCHAAAQDASLPIQNESEFVFSDSNSEDSASDGSASEEENSSMGASSASLVFVFVKMILVLALVIVIIWFLFNLMKKGIEPGKSDDPFLRKVSQIVLAPGKTAQVVTLLDRAYILGVGDNSVSLIAEVSDRELIQAMNQYADRTQGSARPNNFEEILDIFMPKKRSEREHSPQPRGFGRPRIDQSTIDLIDALKTKRLGDGGEK